MNIDLVIRNFKRNNIKATLFENKDRLIDYLKEQIPHNSIVGVGDSVTLETLGIYDSGNYIRQTISSVVTKFAYFSSALIIFMSFIRLAKVYTKNYEK
ncbi:LUD domain-containing protein [Bacteroides graminisolvens]|uniref:LUD domain-containing protein n=1 Tax=Bacteroides graminisolvens TaxID=477666 RepID=UPI0038992264